MGTTKYAKEEQRILVIKEKAQQSTRGFVISNIASMRNFLLTLTTLSITIFGVVISVISNSGLKVFKLVVENIPIVYIGLGSLALCVLVSVIYLAILHVKENQALSKSYLLQEKTFNSFRSLLLECYKNKKPFDVYQEKLRTAIEQNTEVAELAKKSHKQLAQNDYTTYYISGFFLIGILTVVVSLL
jgi:uncharacterized membrane protein YidH (DUF202 family)